MAFGSIPFDIIDNIRTNSDDLILKLRWMEDLENSLDLLADPQNEQDLMLLQHHSSSFLQFIEEFLLEDQYQEIKIVFTAIKGIKLIINSDNRNSRQLKNRVNFRRLVNNLIGKLNDPKEVVRTEVERVIVDISRHMSS